MGNVADRVVQKMKTYILCFLKWFRLRDKVEKYTYCKFGQSTDDNMVHPHCMLYI